MTRKPIEMNPQADFDHAAHIAAFLQTSAVYLGVSADRVMALSNSAWQLTPTGFVSQAQRASSRRYQSSAPGFGGCA